MIQQARSQFNEAIIKSNEALMKSNEAVEEARDKPGIIVDKDTAHIINLRTMQSNPQLKNGVKVTYQENSYIVKDNKYEFSNGFIKFFTNRNMVISMKMKKKKSFYLILDMI